MGWEDPLEKGRLHTPVSWPEFRGLYSPWGHKESDTTQQLSLSVETIRMAVIPASYISFWKPRGSEIKEAVR